MTKHSDNASVSNVLLSRPLTRFGVAMGGLTLMASGTGGIVTSNYVDQHLAPAIAADLSTSLNRPVHLGPVTGISPTSIRFGPSSIPATEHDADDVAIEAIAIRFSLLNLLEDGEVPLSVTMIRSEIYLDQNSSGSWLDTKIDLSSDSAFPVREISFRNTSLTLKPFYQGFKVHPRASEYLAREATLNGDDTSYEMITPSDEVQLSGINASFVLDDQEEFLAFTASGRADKGGRVHGKGKVLLDGGRVDADIHAHQLAIPQFAALLPSAILVEDGELDGRIQFVGEPGAPIMLQGTAHLKNFSAWAEGEPNPFTNTHGTLTFDGQTIHIENGAMTYGWIPFDMEGTVHLENGVNLQAQVKAVDADDFMATFDLGLPFPAEGALKTDNLTVTGAFGQTVFAGTVTDAKPVALDQVKFSSVRTDFTLDKGTDVLTLIDTEFNPVVGGTIAGNARVKLGDIDDAVITANANDISADAIAELYGVSLDDTQLGQLSASTQVIVTEDDLQTNLNWSLTEGTYEADGILALTDDQIFLQDATVHVGNEVLKAEGKLSEGRWQATVSTEGLSLAAAVPDADGALKGQVKLSGDVEDISPTGIQAEGTIEVIDVLPELTEPLQVAFDWGGERLHIQKARTSWFEADGWVDAEIEGTQPDITSMDLNLYVHEMDLPDLPVELPIPVTGSTKFAGKLTGTPEKPQLNGQLQLSEFTIGAIAFDSDLSGPVQFNSDQTVELALAGTQDIIKAAGTVDDMNFELHREDAAIQGQFAGEQLTATLHDIPLGLISQNPALNLSPNSLLTALDGRLSGQITADWADNQNPTLNAEVSIANPMVGSLPERLKERHMGDRLTGTITYVDNKATLKDAELQFGQSQLRIAGQFTPNELTGDVNIHHGDLRDLITLLRATPTDMELPGSVMAFSPQENSSNTFDIDALMDSYQQVRGTFTGDIGVSLDPQTSDIQAQVGLSGDNWRLGEIKINQIRLADGQLKGAYLDIPELRLSGIAYGDHASPNTTLVASLNTQHQTGSVQLEGVPLTLVSELSNSPVTVGGELGAIAHWKQDGIFPKVNGTLSLQNPSLGGFSTDAVDIGFSFQDDVVQIGRWRLPGNPTELITTGRIPIRLPFMASVPDAPLSFVDRDLPLAQGEDDTSRPEARTSERNFAVDGADQLIFSLGLLQPSLSIAELETLIETEEVPDGWGIYLDIADLNPEDIKSVVTQEIPLDLTLVDHAMNSSLGEQFLTFVGKVIHTPSGHANVQALRSALVFSTHDDGRVSIMEFLSNYPHDEVYVDLNELGNVLEMLEEAQSK